jgi:hypothetical protein
MSHIFFSAYRSSTGGRNFGSDRAPPSGMNFVGIFFFKGDGGSFAMEATSF